MSCTATDTPNCTATFTILDKLSSPVIDSLLSIHPNDITLTGGELPSLWSSWWSWATSSAVHKDLSPAWLRLIRYLCRRNESNTPDFDIPPELGLLIDTVRDLQLQRDPVTLPITSAHGTCDAGYRTYGMSPKKEHEVQRMSSYIHHLINSSNCGSVPHAVDVGSGQGYLSRALQDLGLHVLALDNNENQTSGADRWNTKEAARKLKRERRKDHDGVSEASKKSTAKEMLMQPEGVNTVVKNTNEERKGSLIHRTVNISTGTLEKAISDWILTESPGIKSHEDRSIGASPTRSEHVPAMFVALHACGSLTVDVLRTFLSCRHRRSDSKVAEPGWRPHSLVVVGCCYNLMSPCDFPLSKALREVSPTPRLQVAALHLAAQVPSQWLKSQPATQGAELAIRKVVYRALLQPVLQAAAQTSDVTLDNTSQSERDKPPMQPGLGETSENRRLGKLNNDAYKDWPTFLDRALDKMGISIAELSGSLPDWFFDEGSRLKMENGLSVLHTLRCILGPLIETLIVLDRYEWIRHELAEMNDGGQKMVIEMVNLFDQAVGSGRNIALVIKPVDNHTRGD
ncbi:methyltransferase domain-containing protein [Melanogaster broomeanus]|nr:methyltransferase domain-containing protein [Melanogaster broomeanus]